MHLLCWKVTSADLGYGPAGTSSTIALTNSSIASVTRFAGKLKLLERMEKTTTCPVSVVAYPESAFTPPREPVLATMRFCKRGDVKRSVSEPSTPGTGKVAL